jgi:hypothetical protein
LSRPARLLHLCSAAALALAVARPAHAQPHPPPGDATVVAIDSGELVVDIGATRGVRDGDLLELWRPVRLRHPVTGAMLVDRFRIGSLRLTQVRSALSLSVIEGAVSRPPATGDVVVLQDHGGDGMVGVVKATTPVTTKGRVSGTATATAATATADKTADKTAEKNPEGTTPSTTTVAPVDGDARALSEMMTALTGSDPAHRALAYETFALSHPRSRFARVLREEVEALRAPAHTEKTYQWSAPKLDRVRAGEPQSFAVELDPAFVGAVVHVRHKGAAGYRSLPMENVGPRYWSATLPGDAITDGGMEYFVEGVPKESAAVAVIGSAATPRDVVVEALPGSPRPPGTLAQVSLQSEYASFNTKRANDYVWQTEGSVGWRLHDQGIRAIRSGFGVLRGEGGPLVALDELGQAPTKVGLTYGYVEAEFAPSHSYAFIARPILGLRERGITGGALAFVRIGNDLATNLSVGGEVLGSVGQRGIVQLDWRTIRRVPVVLRTEVTNMPAGSSDVGARAIAQVGYQLTNELVVAVRGSYQGRTINHAGPGAGLAVSYQW